MKKLVRPYLSDVLEQIDDIEKIMQGISLNDYLADRVLQKVVERSVEIISEASRRIPEELRQTQPLVPWPNILTIGNVLRHEYRDVIDEIMFAVVREHLPSLKAAVLAIDANLDEPRE
jgi:uncharacterized protein with HEPN domain